MELLLNVMSRHPKKSEIQRICLQFMLNHDPSALNPLTRDLSGLGFVEMQNGHIFATCW